MNKGKIVGYYGNGAPKYENDEANYANKGYSPTYNPGNSVNFSRKNGETYYTNNGVYPKRYY